MGLTTHLNWTTPPHHHPFILLLYHTPPSRPRPRFKSLFCFWYFPFRSHFLAANILSCRSRNSSAQGQNRKIINASTRALFLPGVPWLKIGSFYRIGSFLNFNPACSKKIFQIRRYGRDTAIFVHFANGHAIDFFFKRRTRGL